MIRLQLPHREMDCQKRVWRVFSRYLPDSSMVKMAFANNLRTRVPTIDACEVVKLAKKLNIRVDAGLSEGNNHLRNNQRSQPSTP